MKPKLAEGSRWEGDTVVDNCNSVLAIDRESGDIDVGFEVDGSLICSLYPTDALAVIRSAGLDAVWDAAVAMLRVHRSNSIDELDYIYAREDLFKAVEAASGKDPRDA